MTNTTTGTTMDSTNLIAIQTKPFTGDIYAARFDACDSYCYLCERPVKESTAFLVNPAGSDPATLGPVAEHLGSDPAGWGFTVGPTCAKKIPSSHKIKSGIDATATDAKGAYPAYWRAMDAANK